MKNNVWSLFWATLTVDWRWLCLAKVFVGFKFTICIFEPMYKRRRWQTLLFEFERGRPDRHSEPGVCNYGFDPLGLGRHVRSYIIISVSFGLRMIHCSFHVTGWMKYFYIGFWNCTVIGTFVFFFSLSLCLWYTVDSRYLEIERTL